MNKRGRRHSVPVASSPDHNKPAVAVGGNAFASRSTQKFSRAIRSPHYRSNEAPPQLGRFPWISPPPGPIRRTRGRGGLASTCIVARLRSPDCLGRGPQARAATLALTAAPACGTLDAAVSGCQALGRLCARRDGGVPRRFCRALRAGGRHPSLCGSTGRRCLPKLRGGRLRSRRRGSACESPP